MSKINFSFTIKEYNEARDYALIEIRCEKFIEPTIAREFTINTININPDKDLFKQINEVCVSLVADVLLQEDNKRKTELISFINKNRNITFTRDNTPEFANNASTTNLVENFVPRSESFDII